MPLEQPRRGADRRRQRRRVDFVGGDTIGIWRDTKDTDAAWNFISWLLATRPRSRSSPRAAASVRTDLADNQYSSADPRLVMFNTVAGKGKTPFAKNFSQTYNDPQSPWIVLLREAVFGDAERRSTPTTRDHRVRCKAVASSEGSAWSGSAGPPRPISHAILEVEP